MSTMKKEKEMYPLISSFFEQRGYTCYHMVRPLFCNDEMDVVCLKLQQQKLVNVEAKLHRYKQTLKQVERRASLVDKSYLAFPKQYLSTQIGKQRKETLQEKG